MDFGQPCLHGHLRVRVCSALLGARWEPWSRRCIWGSLCCALRVNAPLPQFEFLWGVVSLCGVWFNPLEDGACHLTTSRTDKRATKHKRPGAGAAGRSARRVQIKNTHPCMPRVPHEYLQRAVCMACPRRPRPPQPKFAQAHALHAHALSAHAKSSKMYIAA